MAEVARFVALFAVLTLSHQQLVQANSGSGKRWLQQTYPHITPQIDSRPNQWYNGLENGFKQVQFGNANYNNFGTQFTLNHMISWDAIADVIGMELEKWASSNKVNPPTSLIDFVNAIFTVDPQAYVNSHFCQNVPQQPPFCFAGKHKQIIQHPPLTAINNNLIVAASTAIAIIRSNRPVTARSNGAHVRALLVSLFNAPANLRYGESRTNFSIGENLDPMGGATRENTNFEGVMHAILPRDYGLSGWVQYDNCVATRSCIKSSTGAQRVNNRWVILAK